MAGGDQTAERVRRAFETVRERLLSERGEAAHWTGELSASALSTATAVSALCVAGEAADRERVRRGVAWLERTRNADGGWGDTVLSRSNVSTTHLVLAALKLAGGGRVAPAEGERYAREAGGLAAVEARYGLDRTFSAPILANLAIAGLVDWRECPRLPWWLAALPRGTFGALGLPVVSYALPALIAVGLAIDRNTGKARRVDRALRERAAGRVLRVLARITPASGGYLEAVPITCFVAMCLAAAGERRHPVVGRNLRFVREMQAADGSWRIERDLSIWLTTLSVEALGGAGARTRDWLISHQGCVRHPYVGSAPGGWGWTGWDGSVPDADDTSGAVLALSLMPESAASRDAAVRGIRWLLGLQNRDGGWPTFCRGWQKLPFDQSCPDITAHALRAMAAWRESVAGRLGERMERATARGLDYLDASQREDGSWVPLWFGSESAPREENAVYGTARVLRAYGALRAGVGKRAIEYLCRAQRADGSWGDSVEETALAVDGLCGWAGAERAAGRGAGRLVRCVESGALDAPAPIGLYFATLWYFERLYPLIFAASALRRMLGAGYDAEGAEGA